MDRRPVQGLLTADDQSRGREKEGILKNELADENKEYFRFSAYIIHEKIYCLNKISSYICIYHNFPQNVLSLYIRLFCFFREFRYGALSHLSFCINVEHLGRVGWKEYFCSFVCQRVTEPARVTAYLPIV